MEEEREVYAVSEREIKLKIEDKISEFVPELLRGKHIEIHLSKDDIVKIFSVDKKIIK